MLVKSLLFIATVALSAIAADAPSGADIADRFNNLGVHYKTLTESLRYLPSGAVTTDEIIASYNETVADETKYEESSQPTEPYTAELQKDICAACVAAVGSGLKLEKAFIENAQRFSKDQRQILRDGHKHIKVEIEWFVDKIAPVAVLQCAKGIKTASEKLYDSIAKVQEALDKADQEE